MRLITVAALILTAMGCASAQRALFDPSVDPRIGAEVDKACLVGNSVGGGYISVDDRAGFLTGRLREKYLLVFSSGCGDLGPSGSFPVFRNYGDNCRRTGEVVQTARTGGGVSGGCTIQHIYEWNEDAEEDDAEE